MEAQKWTQQMGPLLGSPHEAMMGQQEAKEGPLCVPLKKGPFNYPYLSLDFPFEKGLLIIPICRYMFLSKRPLW